MSVFVDRRSPALFEARCIIHPSPPEDRLASFFLLHPQNIPELQAGSFLIANGACSGENSSKKSEKTFICENLGVKQHCCCEIVFSLQISRLVLVAVAF